MSFNEISSGTERMFLLDLSIVLCRRQSAIGESSCPRSAATRYTSHSARLPSVRSASRCISVIEKSCPHFSGWRPYHLRPFSNFVSSRSRAAFLYIMSRMVPRGTLFISYKWFTCNRFSKRCVSPLYALFPHLLPLPYATSPLLQASLAHPPAA
ncbi:MAG: hypothetical protein G01um101491_114 [Parcubacteria group bacterium Gr01-1014_91]|nr:MAG: hypothetical protein G01um101491_114 [Parcubacteria group bacterium Gr01-1014_91]